MGDTKDMVYFLMPDGTKVSNDPRFDLEEAMTKALNSRPTTGDIGVPHDEQIAQTQVEHVDQLNSGQPGVGENAVPDDVQRNLHGPLGSPAQQRQVEDVQKAKEAGATPDNTSVEDDDPVDSNEAVKQVREAKDKARELHQKAIEKLGDEGPGDPNKPYSEWSGKQLMAEITGRNAEEDRAEENKLKAKKKGEAVAALEADDERRKAAGSES